MNVSKSLMKFHIQQMEESVDYIKIDKEQLKAIKADTAGTPLGKIYQKMYYAPVKLVTEKGRVKLLQRFGKANANNVPAPQEINVASVEDIKMTDDKVDGRSLHEFLQIETRYNDWFERMKEYGFVEGVDFYSKMSKNYFPLWKTGNQSRLNYRHGKRTLHDSAHT